MPRNIRNRFFSHLSRLVLNRRRVYQRKNETPGPVPDAERPLFLAEEKKI